MFHVCAKLTGYPLHFPVPIWFFPHVTMCHLIPIRLYLHFSLRLWLYVRHHVTDMCVKPTLFVIFFRDSGWTGGCVSLEHWNVMIALLEWMFMLLQQFSFIFFMTSLPYHIRSVTVRLVTVAVRNLCRYLTWCQHPDYPLCRFTCLACIHDCAVLVNMGQHFFILR